MTSLLADGVIAGVGSVIQLLGRARVFLCRAGTVIFTVAVIVWALASYPRSDEVQAQSPRRFSGPTLGHAAVARAQRDLAERLAGVHSADGVRAIDLLRVVPQCAATLAVIRREANSWRWPVFVWTYVTAMGYLGAMLVYQVES